MEYTTHVHVAALDLQHLNLSLSWDDNISILSTPLLQIKCLMKFFKFILMRQIKHLFMLEDSLSFFQRNRKKI